MQEQRRPGHEKLHDFAKLVLGEIVGSRVASRELPGDGFFGPLLGSKKKAGVTQERERQFGSDRGDEFPASGLDGLREGADELLLGAAGTGHAKGVPANNISIMKCFDVS